MTASKVTGDNSLSSELKQLIKSIQAGSHAILPRFGDDLLNSIVETAARLFNAAAASILLIDEEEQLLEFKVAYGASSHDLVGTRFPLNQGIAGYVVMTGQPLAISNVRQDKRFNQDFAKSTGYVPKSILAMPLKIDEKVIGVMEVLDKISAASFGMQDMDLLGTFAHQAALAIDLSQRQDQVQRTMLLGLKRLARNGSNLKTSRIEKVLEDTSQIESDEELLALADLFNHISSLGEAERLACLQVLKAFADLSQSNRRTRHGR